MGFKLVQLPVLVFFRFGRARSSNNRSGIHLSRSGRQTHPFLHHRRWLAPDRYRRRHRLRALNAVVLYKMVVARVDAVAQAAATLMKHRLVDIVRRDRDGFSALNIGHRALVDGLGDRLFNLRLITAQKRWRLTALLFFLFRRRSMNRSYALLYCISQLYLSSFSCS